jgi:hypothetical protein
MQQGFTRAICCGKGKIVFLNVRFEVFTAGTVKNAVSWDVMSWLW